MEKITNIFVKCLLSEAVTEFAERGKLKCEIDKEEFDRAQLSPLSVSKKLSHGKYTASFN